MNGKIIKERLVETQPNFGNNQIKNVSEIEMGKLYRRHHHLGTEIVIPVRQCYNKEGWIKAKSIFDSEMITEKDISIASIIEQSLSDWGIIPYSSSNKYNSDNWLEKVKKEDMMAKNEMKNNKFRRYSLPDKVKDKLTRISTGFYALKDQGMWVYLLGRKYGKE